MTGNYILSLYYPNERALMFGINAAAYGLGAGMWVLLSTQLNNPNGIPPTNTIAEPLEKPFPKEVADNYPIAQLILCGIFAVLSLTVFVLIPNYPDSYGDKTDDAAEEKEEDTNMEDQFNQNL